MLTLVIIGWVVYSVAIIGWMSWYFARPTHSGT